MDAGGVGGLRHDPAEGVDFFYQVPFGYAPDGGVAGHLADGFQVDGDQYGFAAHFGRCVRGLYPGMTGSDDYDFFHFFSFVLLYHFFAPGGPLFEKSGTKTSVKALRACCFLGVFSLIKKGRGNDTPPVCVK
jgi:hypothetical protein